MTEKKKKCPPLFTTKCKKCGAKMVRPKSLLTSTKDLEKKLAETEKQAEYLDQLWFEINDCVQEHWTEGDQPAPDQPVSQPELIESINILKEMHNKLKATLALCKVFLPDDKYHGLLALIKDIK